MWNLLEADRWCLDIVGEKDRKGEGGKACAMEKAIYTHTPTSLVEEGAYHQSI